MAIVQVIEDHLLVIRNSSFKWTLAWAFFVSVLLGPAIYCLAAAADTADSGRAEIPEWVGALLLVFAILSCGMLMPFTIFTTTRMDKLSDTFIQDHGVLNCIPCSCLPTTQFALSVIERVDVEEFIHKDDDDFDDVAAVDKEEDSDSNDEDAMKEFELRYGKPKAQVFVHTKYESVPLTAITSGAPSCLPCRNSRMSAKQIKNMVDKFLGLDTTDAQTEADPEREAAVVAEAEFRNSSPQQREEKTATQSAGVGALNVSNDMLEFMNTPAALRPKSKATPNLITNPVGRPVLAQVQARARPSQVPPPPQVRSKMEVESETEPPAPRPKQDHSGWHSDVSEETPVQLMHDDSWKNLPGEDPNAKWPKKKKNETEEERRIRKSAKKAALKKETPEEREARKAAKKARKMRKAQRQSFRSLAQLPAGDANNQGDDEDSSDD